MADGSTRTAVLLEGNLAVYPKASLKYHVSVTNAEISYVYQEPSSSKKASGHVIKFLDVVGADCMRGKHSTHSTAYLNVYSYPQRKKFASSRTVRKRHCVTFVFSDFPSFEENHRDAMHWQLVIMHLVHRIDVNPADISSLQPLPTDRPLLVLVNPFSGRGTALHMFQRHAVPIFAEAALHYKLLITEHAGHAHQLVKDLVLTDYKGIVIVSGDGLVFEVINGLMNREDWREAIKTPIGILPAGSANALSSALAFSIHEPYLEKPIQHASFLIAKHSLLPLDLVAVDTCTGQRLYSFLEVCWGIVADVDIESERFRSLGNARFSVGAVVRIAGLRKYRGRISFLPLEADRSRMKERSIGSGDANGMDPGTSSRTLECPEIPEDLPPLSSAVPPDWVTIEDDFVMFLAVYLSHISQDLIAAPTARSDDGVIHLFMIRAPVSRVRMVKLLNSMEDGTVSADPAVEAVRVSAFRLEPLGRRQGALTVDGEVVDYGPLQARILPSMARVMSLDKD